MGHARLEAWVGEMVNMCQPDKVEWITGAEDQQQRLLKEALGTAEMIELDQARWPGCYYHRTNTNDVARVEHLTYICTPDRDDAGPNNNWMAPDDAYRRAREIFTGSMKGRTMYVVPFSMGPVGSRYSKIGVELTDSIYVVRNMMIMCRCGQPVLDALGSDGEFTRGLHGRADVNPGRRMILHFPQDNTIWSVGSGYGGNVLLGKKCLALRIASYQARREGWLAEHMLILGIEREGKPRRYIAAAFPSACGKTNLAMLVPPKGLQVKGYRVFTVGDDIAWMRVSEQGRLVAFNPETGFFGVAPYTSMETNPNALLTVKKNSIFTNVVLTADGDIWWEGMGTEPPEKAFDWMGRPWYPGKKDADGKVIAGAHANSRFTAPIDQCPCLDREADPEGVPIDAIVFGGRRARVAPLVYEAFDWAHGVYAGATMASERTAAQYGKQGEVRRDPMAMWPFCGYNMADYFAHWLAVGERLGAGAPRIFNVNWFRQNEQGKFIWPGYGENLRVLEWILARCEGTADARRTPIGYVPQPNDIDLAGLDMSANTLEQLLSIDPDDWSQELADHKAFFESFGDRIPKGMWAQYEALKTRLSA